MTTVLLNLHNAGLYPLGSMILAMGLVYGGLAQVIAGVMEFKKGNTFGTLPSVPTVYSGGPSSFCCC
jgi:succinate-acetate transporter protein